MSGVPSVGRLFRFDGIGVRATCEVEADLEWIEEFVCPWLAPESTATADCHVTLRIDAAAYERRLAAGPSATGETLHCFWQDRGAVRLPRWQAAPDESCVFEQDHLKVFYTVGPEPTQIEVLANPGNPHARFAMMRVIRELALIHTRAKGRILVHGAALAVDGRGFVISGPKGAGKTSLLMAHLLAGGADFVSNDRLVVRVEGNGVVVRGMPTVVSVRRPTLDAHPDMHARLQRSGYHHRLTLAEALRGEPSSFRSRDGSIDLTPAQLCQLAGVRPRAEAGLYGILFPAPSAVDGAAMLAEIDPAEAAARLADALLDSDVSEPLVQGFFGSVVPAAAAPVRDDGETIRRMANVPSFELRPAAAGPDGRGMLADVVRRVAA